MVKLREIEVDQGSPDWASIRAGYVTPSKFHVICNGTPKGKNTYLRSLINREHGDGGSCSKATSWGKYHENEAFSQYQLISTELLNVRKAGFFVREDIPFVGGSPDAVIFGSSHLDIVGGSEIKAPYNSENHGLHLSGHIPELYWYQMHGYMWLFDVHYWDFVSYDPRWEKPDERVYIKRVHRDSATHARIDAAITDFLAHLGSMTFYSEKKPIVTLRNVGVDFEIPTFFRKES